MGLSPDGFVGWDINCACFLASLLTKCWLDIGFQTTNVLGIPPVEFEANRQQEAQSRGWVWEKDAVEVMRVQLMLKILLVGGILIWERCGI